MSLVRSRRRTPSTPRIASAIRSMTSPRRPSLTFGTHSTSRGIRERLAQPRRDPYDGRTGRVRLSLSFALLQFNPSSVVVMDVEGRIRSLNPNAERLLSTTEARAVGRPYTDVFGPSLSQRVFSLFLKSGKSSEVKAIEATLPDGRRAKLRATAGPLRDESGNATGIVFVADEDASSPRLEAGTELGYGVGVHTGEAMVGNLGSSEYQNYTAIGDTVNVAARLQGYAKAGEVICSAAVLAAAGSGVRATALGSLELKGRKSPVEAFRVEGAE